MVTRGNVAIYCYNALTAKTWDVVESTDGSLTSSSKGETILAKYFSDFTNEAGEMKLVEEARIDESGAITNEIGENQLKITAPAISEAIDAEKAPKRNEEEATYYDETSKKTTNDGVVYYDSVIAYVKEGVANLAALKGKTVDVIFGRDNEVVYIAVVDDAIDNEFVEAYNADEDTITIAGEKYEFASNNSIFVNGVSTTMDEVLTVLGEESEKDFNKVVAANFVVDNKDDITRLDLSVSGTYAAFHTIEAVVTKNSGKVLTYYTLGNSWAKDTYDYEDAADDNTLPRITVDGKSASIEDIEAGNIITMVWGTKTSDVKTIKVSTNIVDGEVTKTQKASAKISVDGTAYASSMKTLVVTEDEIKDGAVKNWGAIEKGDNVALYLNALGEYVLVATDDVNSSDWQFAYLRSIKDVNENDDEQFVAELRLLLADGKKSSAYTVVVDIDEVTADTDNSLDKFETFTAAIDAFDKKPIAFKANSDNEIKLESLADIAKDLVIVDTNASFGGDYTVVALTTSEVIDDKRNEIGAYDFNKDKIICDMEDEKVLSKWSAIIDDVNGTDKLVANATAVVDGSDLVYMFFATSPATTSDEMYAIYVESDDDEITVFDGEDVVREHNIDVDVVANAFAEYNVNSKDEVTSINQLIDIDAFVKETTGAEVITGSATTKLVTKNVTNVKATATAEGFKTAQGGLYGNAQGTGLAMEVIENIAGAGDWTIVHENDALAIAYPNDFADGIKVAEYTFTESEDFAFVLANGEDVKISVYAGHVASTYENEKPVAVYNFTNVEVTTVEEETAVKSTKTFVKDLYAVESTGSLKFSYVDDQLEDYGIETLGTIKVDEDTVVYDLRDGEFVVEDFDYLVEAAEEETIYVVAYANSEAAAGTANILVIVE